VSYSATDLIVLGDFDERPFDDGGDQTTASRCGMFEEDLVGLDGGSEQHWGCEDFKRTASNNLIASEAF